MVIGDPYKFSIIFDRVDKWNMSINDNNGYLNLSIDSEIFPKKLIVARHAKSEKRKNAE